ncbi:MAG: RNA polymerase sigma factor [Solirubrobacteraceae bacterium]
MQLRQTGPRRRVTGSRRPRTYARSSPRAGQRGCVLGAPEPVSPADILAESGHDPVVVFDYKAVSSDPDRAGACEPWDPAAFEALYREQELTVVRFLAHRVRRPELVADLVSEVFAAALLAWRGDGVRPRDQRAWLLGIAHHKLVDSYRRGRVEDQARRALAMRATPISDESLARIEALTAATPTLDLVAALPDEQRDAVRARVIEEQTYAEIAHDLQLSEQVVRKRVSRGLARLRTAIGARR